MAEPATILEAWVKGGAYISPYIGYRDGSSNCSNAGLTPDVCTAINEYFKDGFVSGEEGAELEKMGITGITGLKPLQYYLERLDADLKGNKITTIFDAADRMGFLHDCLKRIGESGEPIDEEFVKSLVERYSTLLDRVIHGEGDISLEIYERIVTSRIETFSSLGHASRYAIPPLIRLTKNEYGDFAAVAYETLAKVVPSALPDYAAQLLQGGDPSTQGTLLWALGDMSCADIAKVPHDSVKKIADNSTDGEIRENASHVLNLSYFCQNYHAEEALPSQRPVACLKGDTPFKTTADCTEKGLLKAYKSYWQDYNRKCGGDYDRHKEECDEMRGNPSLWLGDFEMLDVTHPFFNIYLYMTPDSGFDDIRSAKIFEDVASSRQIRSLVAKKRSLAILYPGSGAHISPIVMALKLIDEGRIDSASLIFTEAGEGNLARLKLYLNWYNEHGTITGLKADEVNFDGASETRFQFSYKGKPVDLLFTLNRTKNDFYANEDHIREADIVVIHDALYEFDDDKVSHLLLKLKSLHGRPQLVITEDWWGLEKKRGVLKLEGAKLPYTSYEGSYGCYGRGEIFFKRHVTHHRLVNGTLVRDTRPQDNQDNIPEPSTRSCNLHVNTPWEALLIEVF